MVFKKEFLMKIRNIYFQLLFVLIIILSLTSCGVNGPGSNLTQQTSLPYPAVEAPYPSPNQSTALAESRLAVTLSSSFAATSSAFPIPTPYLQPTDTYSEHDPVCFVDPSHRFSLVIAPGWYASPMGGHSVTLYNYDYRHIAEQDDVFSNGGMKVSLDVLDVVQGTNFDQYVEDRIEVEQQAAENRLIVTDPISYTLGAYSGVAFTFSGYGLDVMEIILKDGNRIAIIGLMPANSPALPEAMSILSSLDLSGLESCTK